MKMLRIELKTISGKGIGSLALFQRPSLSVSVALVTSLAEGGNRRRRRQVKKTPINRKDGENPEWECPMLLDLRDDEIDDLLEFELTAHCLVLIGDRIVGRVRVPVAELAEEARIVGLFAFRFVTYQVLATDGKPNGTLSFGFRMIDPNLVAPPPHPPAIGYPLPPPPTDPAAYYSPTPESPAYPQYSYLWPESSPSLYPRLSPEPATHLYPPLSPREQRSSFYPPPPLPSAFGYSPDFPPSPAYSPATEGGLQYYNHTSNIYPPPPVGAYGGCNQPENQPYGHRMDAYDRRLYG